MVMVSLFTCTCEAHGKLSFRSRKIARLHLRRNHPGEPGMAAYECDTGSGMWHVGHLPRQVMRGRRARGWIRNFHIDQPD